MKKQISYTLILLLSISSLISRNITIAHDEPDDKVQEYFLSLKGAYEHVAGKNSLAGDTYKILTESFPEQTSSADFNTARLKLAFQEGRHDDVISNSATITGNVKEHPELNLVLAQAYTANNQLPHAEEVLKEVVEHHPNNDSALSQLTVLLIKQRKFSDALNLIKKGIENPELTNKHYLFYFLLAKLHYFTGNKELALASIEKSIELNARSPKSALFKAALLEQNGTIKEAIKGYENYLRLVGSDSSIIKKLIQLYFQEEQYSHAHDLLESHPEKTARYFHDVALVNLKLNKPQVALNAIDKAIEIDSTFTKAYACKVEILLSTKKNEQALDVIFKLIEQQPDRTEPIIQLIELVDSNKISIDALQRKTSKQTEKKPSYLLAFGLGEALQKKELYTEACQWYKTALQDHLINQNIFSPIKSQVLFQLAYISYIKENYSDMLEYIVEAKKCHTVDTHIHNLYAWYLAENNIDLKLAHKEIDIALKHNPNNPYFFDTKGYIYKKQGESDKALSYVRKAHILAPKDSAISKRHMFYNTMNSF